MDPEPPTASEARPEEPASYAQTNINISGQVGTINVVGGARSRTETGEISEDVHQENVAVPFRLDEIEIGENKNFQIFYLEELCSNYLSSKGYLPLLPRLKMLDSLRPNDFKTMLTLAETNMHLGYYDDALDVIRGIKKIILEQPRVEVHVVIVKAERFGMVEGNHLYSLIFFFCACALYKHYKSPDAAMDGIGESLDKIDGLAEKARKESDREKFFQINLRLLQDIGVDLNDLEKEDTHLHARTTLRCIGSQGDCQREINHWNDAILMYKEGIELAKKKFGGNVKKCYMLAEFHWNIHLCYKQLGPDDLNTALWHRNEGEAAIKHAQPATENEKKWIAILKKKYGSS